MSKHIIIFVGLLTLNACTSIWNSGDLRKWVLNEALKSGCQSDSIVLDEWYTEENGKNIWHGHCLNADSKQKMDLSVGVDNVWKPSQS